MSEVEEKVEEKTEEDVAHWKQQAEQEKGNWKRERAQVDTLTAQNETTTEDLQTSQSKVASLEQQLAQFQQQDKFQKVDKDLVDPAVANNLEEMKRQLASVQQTVQAQQVVIETAKQKEQLVAYTEEKQSKVEKMFAGLDSKHGAEYRNDAHKLADQWVEDGKEDQPQEGEWVEATLLFDRAYSEVKANAEKAKEKPTPTDTGSKSSSVSWSKRSQGTFNEVLDDMKKDKSWLKE